MSFELTEIRNIQVVRLKEKSKVEDTLVSFDKFPKKDYFEYLNLKYGYNLGKIKKIKTPTLEEVLLSR